MRLSNNVVFKLFSAFYVEVVRNVRCLLFSGTSLCYEHYQAAVSKLKFSKALLESITGLYLPAPVAENGAGVDRNCILLFSILALAMGRWAKSASMKPEKLSQLLSTLV